MKRFKQIFSALVGIAVVLIIPSLVSAIVPPGEDKQIPSQTSQPALALKEMPDLVVEKLYPSIGGDYSYSNMADYCFLDDNNNLEIRITNQGKVKATGSVDVAVKFANTPVKILKTVGMAPGGFGKITTPIPAACYNPECLFTITVDPDNKIQESNEANNTVSGKCFACVKPKVQRIDFSIVSRTGPYTGRVRILGVMKNLGDVPCNLVHAYIYENNNLVKRFDNTQTNFGVLNPGQEMILGYERDWDASSTSEGEIPPTYKVEITGESRAGGPCASASNSMERSGSDINKLFTQDGIKTMPSKHTIPHTIPLPR